MGRFQNVLTLTTSFAASLFLGGLAVSAIQVFLLGKYEPKFGPQGTFEIGAWILLALTAVSSPVVAALAGLACVFTNFSNTSRRWSIVFGFLAALPILIFVFS